LKQFSAEMWTEMFYSRSTTQSHSTLWY